MNAHAIVKMIDISLIPNENIKGLKSDRIDSYT